MIRVLGWVILLVFLPASAWAQEFGWDLVQHWTSEADIASPAGVRATVAGGPVQFTAEYLRDHHTRPKVYCAGLIPPDFDCSPRLSDIDLSLLTMLLGLRFSAGNVSFNAGGGLTLLRGDWDSRVDASRNSVDGAWLLLGGGADYLQRLGESRWYVRAGGSLRVSLPATANQCADCAADYNDGLTAGGISVGIEVRM